MNEHLKQYRINSNWRYHVLQVVRAMKVNNVKKEWDSILEYCKGNIEYAKALNLWLEFMREEERFSFYNYFATTCIDEARRSLNLLVSRKDKDPDIRMPLLRDVFTAYSRPFKHSHGRLRRTHSLTKTIDVPSPEEIHNKILSDRDQLYAHCDLSPLQPRVCNLGVSFKDTRSRWSDYESLLPAIMVLIDNTMSLIGQYIINEGMDDIKTFFHRFENAEDLTIKEPVLLNKLYEIKN